MDPAAYGVFRYLAAELAPLYREIMRAFVASKQQFVVTLRPEEIVAVLGASRVDEVRAGLAQLELWGNLRSDPDTSRVTTVQDFHRARLVYQLTQAGETAERALEQFDATLGARGSLQAAALEDIVDQLRALVRLRDEQPLDEGKTGLALTTLSARFEVLADNAQAFAGSLRRTIDLRGIDEVAFLAYKERLIEYLGRFVQDLVVQTASIAGLVDELTDSGVERLLQAAADRDARDDAPDAPPGVHLTRWRQRWSGFRQWFIGSPAAESQSMLLRRLARGAIPELLRAAQAINERRSTRTDRSADFHALALWFAEAPDDDSRHRLARVAFGLASARHLSIDGDTVDARARFPVAASTSWKAAPPVEISPRLRARGRWERSGAPGRVTDRSAERAAIARAVEEQAQALDAVREQLLTDGPRRLDELRLRDPVALAAFLGLVGQALGRVPADGSPIDIASLDGAFRITLVPGPATPLVPLRTGSGVLLGPAHRIGIAAAS